MNIVKLSHGCRYQSRMKESEYERINVVLQTGSM